MPKGPKHSRPAAQRQHPPARAAGAPPVHFLPPLKPHRALFVLLAIVLAAWLAFLLVLWFQTEQGKDTHNLQHSSAMLVEMSYCAG